MKKLNYIVVVGCLFCCSCASQRNLEDANVSIYFGKFRDASCYFYLDKGSNFYMLDYASHCEIGICRISQDTLYCYPRFYKPKKMETPAFQEIQASKFYFDVNDGLNWKDLFEIKYYIKDDKLYALTAVMPKIYSDIFSFPEDAFLHKIKIKYAPKFIKKVLFVH